ncbi:MAG: hypothetical protein BWY44_00457 [Candidatus Omnitrophica bacterium ADurb.Bin292]|nr:MAG: hypothetical protein BWY44_00457 [Candidatus Omnitrophica bacterium ADurb.Bin292]
MLLQSNGPMVAHKWFLQLIRISIKVTRQIMRKNIETTIRMIMSEKLAKCASRVELRTEKTHTPFYEVALRVKQGLFFGRILDAPVALRVGRNSDIFLGQLCVSFRFWLESVISKGVFRRCF